MAAVFTNQSTYLDSSLRPYAEAIFGKFPIGAGFQWHPGQSHANDPDPSKNSKAINDALASAQPAPQSYCVVLLDP